MPIANIDGAGDPTMGFALPCPILISEYLLLSIGGAAYKVKKLSLRCQRFVLASIRISGGAEVPHRIDQLVSTSMEDLGEF